MRQKVELLISTAIAAAANAGELAIDFTPDCAIERPRDPNHGDWASTVALKLASAVGRNPREIANTIAAHIAQSDMVAAVDVAGPGFINIRLSPQALQNVVREAFLQGNVFARSDLGEGQSMNVEFISANPTGPMHVGHGRWAALGNAICNVCEHAGWRVTREFYVNDAGHQMDVFGNSVALRYRELQGETIVIPEEFYGGSYVIDIARQIDLEHPDFVPTRPIQPAEGFTAAQPAAEQPAAPLPTEQPAAPLPTEQPAAQSTAEQPVNQTVCEQSSEQKYDFDLDMPFFREHGYQLMLTRMRDVCERVGVHFDVWFSERTLYEGALEATLKKLDDSGYLYLKDGATWFKTSQFGDDKDRVLVKSDGTYTYFAPDIAYHLNKLEREPGGSERLVNIWGADHHGYIQRMQSALAALGHEGQLTVVLGQLVNLYRGGEAVRMSKRSGEMVTFEELIDEVGADATKFLMLSRSSDQAIDFDIDVARAQDSSNPVYYVQYAHARICAMLRKAAEEMPESAAALQDEANSAVDISILVEEPELALARELARLSEVIEIAARDLAPFRLTYYAQELARAFHDFYTRCPVLKASPEVCTARLYLAQATRNVLALTLSLLGVSAPERM